MPHSDKQREPRFEGPPRLALPWRTDSASNRSRCGNLALRRRSMRSSITASRRRNPRA